jgi:CsoR family transcriptional regulator, copper-sensing transcriptional repressor
MRPEVKQECLKRLSFVSGHLDGVRRMVESDEYCVNVLRQTHAVRRAIEKVEGMLLEGHLRDCVVEGVREGRQDQVIDELLDLYQVSNK